MRTCSESNDKILCDRYYNQTNERKELEANLNLLESQPPNQIGHIFP